MPGSSTSRRPEPSWPRAIARSSRGRGRGSSSGCGRSRPAGRSSGPQRPREALVAAWRPGDEPADSGFTERARARIRDGAFYGPPRYRNEIEKLARDRAQADAGPERRDDLGQPLARVDREPVSLLELKHEANLVQREHGQVEPRQEDRRADDPVSPRKARYEPLADRAA